MPATIGGDLDHRSARGHPRHRLRHALRAGPGRGRRGRRGTGQRGPRVHPRRGRPGTAPRGPAAARLGAPDAPGLA
ncbi:hypothetical protein SGPA1_21822 [Streptomyces misionensis JCM 4497]